MTTNLSSSWRICPWCTRNSSNFVDTSSWIWKHSPNPIGLHYKQNKVIVSVKRYFFKKYYLKPLADDPRHRSKISNMFWTSCRFIAGYLVKASVDCKVTREEFDALVAENWCVYVLYSHHPIFHISKRQL